MRKNNNNRLGFTIIELVVVITVMGILIGISTLSYNNWRQSILIAQLKSDLSGAVASMEDARNFGTGYPVSVPSTFTASADVTINGGSDDGKTFCIYATNSKSPTLSYHIDSIDTQTAQPGVCNPDYPPPSVPVTTVALNQNNVQATITPVTCSGGGSPVPQYSIRSRINDGAWGGYSSWSSTLTSQQLANDGVKYGYQVRARCYTAPSFYSASVAGVEGTYTDSNVVHTDYTVSSATGGCDYGYTNTYTHNGWTITAVNYSGDGWLDGGVGTASVRGVTIGDCDSYYPTVTINSVTYHNP